MSVLFVFLDGVGHGENDPSFNPFAAIAIPTLDALAGGDWLSPTTPTLDATLGAEGLPQSATGQATLLTGRNATTVMNGPYGPWPGPTLQRFLVEGNLFTWTAERHGPETMAWGMAYPPGFFEALERRRLRLNAPAYAAQAAGVRLPDLDAYARGEAVAADLDGAYFASLGIHPPGGAPAGAQGARQAGERIARHAAVRRFTFVDIWSTDRVGHQADLEQAITLVERLDAFLAGVCEARTDNTTVLVTSDHGNLEDLRHGRHTMNRVPLLIEGPHADAFQHATSLLDVAPGLKKVMEL